VWERSLLEMLTGAGFADAAFHGWTGYFTSSCTQGGLITARKPAGNPADGDRGMTVGFADDERA
jgi:hypothetical protein